jgi:adenylate cyclase
MAEQAPAVGMQRKLAAIFSTDVAGYSRLMGDDEEATIRTLTAYRTLISSLIQRYRGRVVDSPGDNLLAEFASVIDTVRCAVEIQQELKGKNAELPENRQMQFRIGINLGDVIVEGERLYGDGVNIAARLEGLAAPGGICISGTVYDQVETKLSLNYEYQGEQAVKNITKPVRVYRIVMDATAAILAEQAVLRHVQHEQTSTPFTRSVSKGAQLKRRGGLLLAGVVLMVGGIVIVRYLSHPPLNPQPSALVTEGAKPPSLPLPDKPSLIVLPFVNMSKDPDQEYFSNGLTDVLTGDLSRISSLFVIARNSAFTYKGKAVNMQEIRKELGVRYVLEGSVQKAGEQVRIVTQLIDTTTDSHLWSERYDRPFKDIFTLQDEIVQKIVTTLKLQLTLREQGIIVRKHTNNLEAYDYFLRGVESFHRLTQEANAQARQMFEKALALDSQYAEAVVFLGWTYREEWMVSWSTDPQTLEHALVLAQQALALDDSLPSVHVLLGFIYEVKQQYDQAIAEGERAVALDPNHADGYAVQADALNFAGRPEEALRAIAQAMRLNPHYPWWYVFDVGWAYWMTGRYAEAIATLKESISQFPNFIYSYTSLATSYGLQWVSQQSPAGQTLEPAVAAMQRALALNDTAQVNHFILGWIYLYQRQYEQALAETKQGVALGPKNALSYAFLAEVLSSIGKTDEALEAAAQALRLKPLVADEHLSHVGAAYAVVGHYEEAVAPLKRYLSRYPNRLDAHLMLAAVYSELGQTAEAQKEVAEVLRLNPKFSLEVHKQRMPIKDPAVLERHIAALRKAGLK